MQKSEEWNSSQDREDLLNEATSPTIPKLDHITWGNLSHWSCSSGFSENETQWHHIAISQNI